MKERSIFKKKVIIAIFTIAILSIITIFIAKQPDEKELPAEIKAEIERLFLESDVLDKMDTSRWSVDKENKRINIFLCGNSMQRTKNLMEMRSMDGQ